MSIIDLAYLIATILFILGLKSLNSPETARRGMNFAAIGMFIAIFGTLFPVVPAMRVEQFVAERENQV